VIFGLWWFIEKTPYGMIIRAGSRDPEMVRVLGISLKPIMTLVFGLGAALAGFAGVLAAPLAGVQPAMGDNVGNIAFVVVVIGGLGSFWGAILSGLLVGEVENLSILVWPPIAQSAMYILMIIILLIRPRGLFGERWERFD
jgi:branched-chain amino acid transport system permease protein